jgi:hypothetical protein
VVVEVAEPEKAAAVRVVRAAVVRAAATPAPTVLSTLAAVVVETMLFTALWVTVVAEL